MHDDMENADEGKMDEAVRRCLSCAGIVVAGRGGVFDGAVVGHGRGSPESLWAGHKRVSAIVAEGQRRPQTGVDGFNPAAARASAWRLATTSTEKLLDRLVEQRVEIQFGAEVQEHRAEADRGAVHEHKFARHRDRCRAA